LDAQVLQKQGSQSKWPRYININPTHRQNRIFMHNISKKISITKYSNILKSTKNLKKTKEDTANTMEWEEMCRECQNLEKNLREKHTTLQDKSIKMQRCVCMAEKETQVLNL